MCKLKSFITLILTAAILMLCISGSVLAEDRPKYGDVNNDGGINLQDCVAILKYIARWEIEERVFNFDHADVTHDDKVTISDASKLLKYIAKWHIKFHDDTVRC